MPKKIVNVEITVKLSGDEKVVVSDLWPVEDKALEYFHIASISQRLFVAARECYRYKEQIEPQKAAIQTP